MFYRPGLSIGRLWQALTISKANCAYLYAMLLRLILWGFFLYVIYKFIFELVLPIYNSTKEVKRGFEKMQRQMNEQMRQQAAQARASSPSPTPEKKKKESSGDYIDFEEVK